ncbi:hypothetical protein D3C80_2203650 [compost metagenome]
MTVVSAGILKVVVLSAVASVAGVTTLRINPSPVLETNIAWGIVSENAMPQG